MSMAVWQTILLVNIVLHVAATTGTRPPSTTSGIEEVSWGDCPWKSTAPGVRCANVSVPLDWTSGDQQRIYVFATKIPRTTPQAKGTVWFLNGGSGVGGQCFGQSPPEWVLYYNSLGFDFVAPDCRGAGQSTPALYCPDDPDGLQVPSIECAKYYSQSCGPKGMSHFSISQAAHDLAYMIDKLSVPPTYVQGDSFGTFWGQRYLSIFPSQAQAAVMESFIAPNRWEYFQALNNIDWVGKRTLMYCSQDAFCTAYAGEGGDPTAALSNVMDLAEQDKLPCINKLPQFIAPDGDWRAALQVMFGGLTGAIRDTYAFIPPLLHRLRRCSSADVSAITHLWKYINGSSGGVGEKDPCGISQVLLYNLFLSEGVQHPPPPSFEALASVVRKQLFAAPLSDLLHSRQLYDAWPRYSWDNYTHEYPNTSIPILFYNGDLDISSPWANAAYSSRFYNRPTQHLVRLPQVPHVGFLASPVTNSPISCGVQMATQFFLSGGATVDTTCVSYLKPLDWKGNSTQAQLYSMQLFGTPDPWGLDH